MRCSQECKASRGNVVVESGFCLLLARASGSATERTGVYLFGMFLIMIVLKCSVDDSSVPTVACSGDAGVLLALLLAAALA